MKIITKYIIIVICLLIIITIPVKVKAKQKEINYIYNTNGDVVEYKDLQDLKDVYTTLESNLNKTFYIKVGKNLDFDLIDILICNQTQNIAKMNYLFNAVYSYRLDAYAISLNNLETKEQRKENKKTLDKIYETLNIKEDDTDYTKAKKIHDYIIRNIEYTTEEYYTINETLHNNKAKCDGFAVIFKELGDRAGLESRIVNGFKNGVLHAWNQIKMDNGKWYIIDCSRDAIEYRETGEMYNHFLKYGKNGYILGRVQSYDIHHLKATEPYKVK